MTFNIQVPVSLFTVFWSSHFVKYQLSYEAYKNKYFLQRLDKLHKLAVKSIFKNCVQMASFLQLLWTTTPPGPKKRFPVRTSIHKHTLTRRKKPLFLTPGCATLSYLSEVLIWTLFFFFLLKWGVESFPTSQACGPQHRKHSTMNCSVSRSAPRELWGSAAMLNPICSSACLPAPSGLGICEFKASKGFENVQKVKC